MIMIIMSKKCRLNIYNIHHLFASSTSNDNNNNNDNDDRGVKTVAKSHYFNVNGARLLYNK